MLSEITLNNMVAIDRPDREMFYYLCRFRRYLRYDIVRPDDGQRITDQDRQLANKLAARIGVNVWNSLIGRSISAIHSKWNLIHMSDEEWLRCAKVTKDVLGTLFVMGVGIPRLTKALHRKRPNFIPVCDSGLLAALQGKYEDKADGVIQCMEVIRNVARQNLHSLASLRSLCHAKGMELTELRILELLYWTVFGPFGTAQQRTFFRTKCQKHIESGTCLLGIPKTPCV